MTILYPIEMLASFPGWSTSFELMYRQEQSRSAGGRTYVKDLGDPLWTATYQSRQLDPNELDYWRARLDAMENGLQTFVGRHMSRCYPIKYPRGTWPTGVSFNGVADLLSVGSNRKSISVSGLPAGYMFSVGDMIQIGDADLHRVMETAFAGGDGKTAVFEVRPHIWPGVDANDSPALTVTVKKPACTMSIVPGSVQSQADPQTGWGAVSFQAVEAR